jgi:mono/diheme cytochrome c family protein
MKRLGFVVAALGIVGLALMAGSATAEEEAAPSAGQQEYIDQKCNMCHAVSTVGIEAKTKSEKMLGPDLVNLADSYEAEWMVKYVKKEVGKEGESHSKPFKGSDEELQALVDWLLEQKAEG